MNDICRLLLTYAQKFFTIFTINTFETIYYSIILKNLSKGGVT